MAHLTPTQIEEMGRPSHGSWKVVFTKDEAIARALMLAVKPSMDYCEFRVEPNTASGIDWLVVARTPVRNGADPKDYIIKFRGEQWRIAAPLK